MRLLLIFPVLWSFLPGRGDAQTYRTTAPSSMVVEIKPDGLEVHQRAVHYETFGARGETWLATITAVSDGVIDDQANKVEVSVDALSGPGLRRVTAFSDDGSSGSVSAPYFVTTQTGCCSPLTRYHVRNIETGAPLFTATGAGLSGLVAVMSVPNRRPAVERWAAYEGHPENAGDRQAELGTLRYGDRNGAIDSLTLVMDVAKQPKDFILELPECGALLWLEPGRPAGPGQPRRPAAGTCFQPPGLSYSTSMFSLEHRPGPLGGFALELSLDNTVYATIPVTDDHLDLTHAKLAPGIRLAPLAPQ